MRIETAIDDGVAIIRPPGALDDRALDNVEPQVAALVERGHRLLAVDCTRVESITSTGVCFLVSLRRRLHAAGGDLVLFDAPDSLRSVLRLTELASQLTVAPTRPHALRQLRSRTARQDAASTHSALSRLVCRLMALDIATQDRPAPGVQKAPSEATCLVSLLLTKASIRE